MKIKNIAIKYSLIDKDTELIPISFEIEPDKWVFTRKKAAFSIEFLLRISESMKTVEEEARHEH